LAKFCPLFIKIKPGQELDLVQGVTALLAEETPPEPRVRGTRRLADFLAQAEYGVIFCGRGVSYGPAREMFQGLTRLVGSLNGRARWLLFPLSGDFNSEGLYHLLLDETGRAGAPDFTAGEVMVHSNPVDFREVDALLVAGADLLWFLPEEVTQDLEHRQVPIVALSPFANRTTSAAAVVLPTALAGIETTEVAYRMDGLPVLLRQLVPTELPPDHQVLRDLDGLMGGQD
jgi:formylmethanofuran dehydrogenase subunit B